MKPTATKNRKKGSRMVGAYVEDSMHEDLSFIATSEHRTLADHIRKLVSEDIAAKRHLLPKKNKTSRK